MTLTTFLLLIHNFLHGAAAPCRPGHPDYRSFTITLRYTHRTRYDSSGRVISPTQRPLPDNTQHSQDTDTMSLAGFESAIRASERPQTHALDRAATGKVFLIIHIYLYSLTLLDICTDHLIYCILPYFLNYLFSFYVRSSSFLARLTRFLWLQLLRYQLCFFF
jgi:hypothetical protein